MSDKANNAMKEVVEKAGEFLGALELVNLEAGSQALADLINSPVGLRDTGKFNVKVKMPTSDELREARRELASAIAAEQWTEGFMMALKVMSIMGG